MGTAPSLTEWLRRLAAGAGPRDARTLAQVLTWLEQHPALDDHNQPMPIKRDWTDDDAARVLFGRYLVDTGRVSDER